MIIKGGDVQQLIETPYAQPYIQIVSLILPFIANRKTNDSLAAVLQCHAEYGREHCFDSADLRFIDLRNHQPSDHIIAPAMVIRPRQRPTLESILEPCSAWYGDIPLACQGHSKADNSQGSDIPINAISVTLATSGM